SPELRATGPLKMMQHHLDPCHPAMTRLAELTQPPEPNRPRRRASRLPSTPDGVRSAPHRPPPDQDQPSTEPGAADDRRPIARGLPHGGADTSRTPARLVPGGDLPWITRHRQPPTEPEDAAPDNQFARDQENSVETPDNPCPSQPQD